MLYNNLTMPCGELPRFGLLYILTEAFYFFPPAVSDDKHARMVEEIADFGIYTVLADTDSFFSNDYVFDSF
jgi:hypothetical protein